MARELRETHEHLRPEVLPYAQSSLILPLSAKALLASMNIPTLMLLVLACGNVALLMFGRAGHHVFPQG